MLSINLDSEDDAWGTTWELKYYSFFINVPCVQVSKKQFSKEYFWASGPFLGNFNPLWCVKLETKNAWKHETFQSLVRRNYLWCYYTYLKTDLISTWIDLIISLEWQVPILPRHFRMVKLFWQLFCPQTEPDFSDLLLTYLNVTQLKWVMIIACASRQIATRMLLILKPTFSKQIFFRVE